MLLRQKRSLKNNVFWILFRDADPEQSVIIQNRIKCPAYIIQITLYGQWHHSCCFATAFFNLLRCRDRGVRVECTGTAMENFETLSFCCFVLSFQPQNDIFMPKRLMFIYVFVMSARNYNLFCLYKMFRWPSQLITTNASLDCYQLPLWFLSREVYLVYLFWRSLLLEIKVTAFEGQTDTDTRAYVYKRARTHARASSVMQKRGGAASNAGYVNSMWNQILKN